MTYALENSQLRRILRDVKKFKRTFLVGNRFTMLVTLVDDKIISEIVSSKDRRRIAIIKDTHLTEDSFINWYRRNFPSIIKSSDDLYGTRLTGSPPYVQ